MKLFHFTYDVKPSSKYSGIENRDVLIEFFMRYDHFVKIESPCRSTMLIEYTENIFTPSFLEAVETAWSDDFWFTISLVARYSNKSDDTRLIKINSNSDNTFSKEFNDLVEEVREKIKNEI
jgi:hypothetical protein